MAEGRPRAAGPLRGRPSCAEARPRSPAGSQDQPRDPQVADGGVSVTLTRNPPQAGHSDVGLRGRTRQVSWRERASQRPIATRTLNDPRCCPALHGAPAAAGRGFSSVRERRGGLVAPDGCGHACARERGRELGRKLRASQLVDGRTGAELATPLHTPRQPAGEPAGRPSGRFTVSDRAQDDAATHFCRKLAIYLQILQHRERKSHILMKCNNLSTIVC